MEKSKFFVFFAIVATFCMHTIVVKGLDYSWHYAHATFYGGSDASGTMGGACGYGNLYTYGYGTNTVALSTQLFNNGASCGQCYQIICDNGAVPQWCNQGTSVTVTATNFCPPNWNLPSDNGGWCNPPREHFDMAQPAFQQIAKTQAGIVPVWYQRVPCWKRGNVRVTLNGFNYYNMFLIWNVGGAGSISQFWVQGDSSGWVQAFMNWGANWMVNGISLNGQALSFSVTNTDWQNLYFPQVVPNNWYFGQTYEGYSNFY